MGKITNRLKSAVHSLFWGLRGGDALLEQKGGTEHNTSTITIPQSVTDNVFQDLLDEKETVRVQEFRDKSYRIFKESGKYTVSVTAHVDEEGNFVDVPWEVSVSRIAFENTCPDFVKHGDLRPRVVQDARHYGTSISDVSSFGGDVPDPRAQIFMFERDDFTPRYFIESYIKRVVVFNNDEKRATIDFYLPAEQRGYNKLDAVIIADLHRYAKKGRGDAFDVKTFGFISDHAWNSLDLCLYKYNNLVFDHMEEYDGNLIFTFKADIVCDGEDVTEKYKVASVDEKYAKEAPKENPEVGAIIRRVLRDKEKEVCE